MASINGNEWKAALKSPEEFKSYMTKYFQENKELTGNYETPSYYEYYTVTLDSKEGLVVTLKTGLNQPASSLPFKDVEHLSIEEFRQLILNKKFEDQSETLTDVFTKMMASEPKSRLHKGGKR
ncbi:MAG: hypothetical protein ABF723_06805 [Lentilactobacillus hilgardii]|uniref:hypothetical protein n=1 Tax=Lentilactobacillus hilgardii TaxID=1588 RepID=UPI001CC1FA6C|nr:hypothetical protein [Lentilactobacillus hilgardii]MBZ2201079.1 hypothetical protein [Lentilactobacillus hilgardii]MBZ2203992.1 hypothetical protein [Lentilactobacillus hilgardii]MCT3400406.1 hypothetical protein [Lentilactobacillus hilgardii]